MSSPLDRGRLAASVAGSRSGAEVRQVAAVPVRIAAEHQPAVEALLRPLLRKVVIVLVYALLRVSVVIELDTPINVALVAPLVELEDEVEVVPLAANIALVE